MQTRAELLCTRQNQIKTEVSDTNERLARFVVVVVVVVADDDDDDDVTDYDYNIKNKIPRYFDLVIFHHLEVEKWYSDLPAS